MAHNVGQAGDRSQEPLMGRADRDEEEENVLYSGQATPRSSSRPGTGHGHAHEADEALRAGMRGAGMQEEDVKPTKYVYGLTLAAGISGLLFGFDTGVISGTLIAIESSLNGRPLTTLDSSIIAASTSLFALLVSPISGFLANSLGRKRVILFADLLFIAGALIQSLSRTVWLMVVGRSIVGLAVGAASFVTPLYIGELAPSRFRGRLVTLNVLFITLGQVIAYVLALFLVYIKPNGWRWMVGVGGIPAAIQMVLMMAMPETPRWLVQAGRTGQAERVLRLVFGREAHYERTVRPVLQAIKAEVRDEEEARRERSRSRPQSQNKAPGWAAEVLNSGRELFGVPAHRRALAISCMLQGLQQLCGFNSLMYFSATLFKLLGFSNPAGASLAVAGTNLVGTVASLALIDKIGRRRILLWSVPIMALFLALCSLNFRGIDLPKIGEGDEGSKLMIRGQPIDRTNAILVLLYLTAYTGAYALGLGNVPWQQSELFPLSVRSLGSSIATATNWAANFVIGITFLMMLDGIGPMATFAIYAVICVVGEFLIWLIYPETKGLGLEETGELLKHGWGVEI